MKKRKKILAMISIVISVACLKETVNAATYVHVLKWDLVDSSKHLDWSGSTKYSKRFNLAVDTWNAYKSGVIRKSSSSSATDVVISDYSEVSSTAGVTSSAGTIKFNTYVLENRTKKERRNCCTHELGHALGLAHNQKGDVMYSKITSIVKLSANDKASYDWAYKYEY